MSIITLSMQHLQVLCIFKLLNSFKGHCTLRVQIPFDKKYSTYALEEWEPLIRPCPFGMWIWSRGELGAEKFGLELPISNSQSDMDPLLFFFLEKALLKELLSCWKRKVFLNFKFVADKIYSEAWQAVTSKITKMRNEKCCRHISLNI